MKGISISTKCSNENEFNTVVREMHLRFIRHLNGADIILLKLHAESRVSKYKKEHNNRLWTSGDFSKMTACCSGIWILKHTQVFMLCSHDVTLKGTEADLACCRAVLSNPQWSLQWKLLDLRQSCASAWLPSYSATYSAITDTVCLGCTFGLILRWVHEPQRALTWFSSLSTIHFPLTPCHKFPLSAHSTVQNKTSAVFRFCFEFTSCTFVYDKLFLFVFHLVSVPVL